MPVSLKQISSTRFLWVGLREGGTPLSSCVNMLLHGKGSHSFSQVAKGVCGPRYK